MTQSVATNLVWLVEWLNTTLHRRSASVVNRNILYTTLMTSGPDSVSLMTTLRLLLLVLWPFVLIAPFDLWYCCKCPYSSNGTSETVFKANCAVPKNNGDTDVTFRIREMNVNF